MSTFSSSNGRESKRNSLKCIKATTEIKNIRDHQSQPPFTVLILANEIKGSHWVFLLPDLYLALVRTRQLSPTPHHGPTEFKKRKKKSPPPNHACLLLYSLSLLFSLSTLSLSILSLSLSIFSSFSSIQSQSSKCSSLAISSPVAIRFALVLTPPANDSWI